MCVLCYVCIFQPHNYQGDQCALSDEIRESSCLLSVLHNHSYVQSFQETPRQESQSRLFKKFDFEAGVSDYLLKVQTLNFRRCDRLHCHTAGARSSLGLDPAYGSNNGYYSRFQSRHLRERSQYLWQPQHLMAATTNMVGNGGGWGDSDDTEK